ncbi:MAG TPA: hypothetical protein VLC54_16600 [Anaeromyxobacter sp.]|nr:hypothetical protein [Anaeromyxobacter sp.]
MFVLVHHAISDPEAFWKDPEEFFAKIPRDLKLHATYPISDGTRATCVWEGPSVAAVRQFIDDATRGLSRNELLAIDEGKAYGLPGGRAAMPSQRDEGAAAPMH